MMIGDGVLTIYPTAIKVEEVLKARARTGDAALGHRLTTFPELVDALDREVADAPPVLSEALAAVLFHEALAAELGRDHAAGAARAVAGEGLRLVGELKAAGLGPAELGAIAGELEAPALRARLELIGRIAGGYARLLARLGRADRHDRERRVLALLARAEATGARPRALAGVEKLVIAEIYDYSLLQFLIASTLIRLVGDAELITLAHPENVDATRFLDRTWNRFVEDPALADKVLPDFVVRGGRHGTLAHVLAGLFVEPKPAGPPPVPDASVAVVAAPGRYAEVEAVGRRACELLAAGTPPDRIAVLARDLAAYRDLVESVARRYQIPVAFGQGRPLLAHGVVQQIVRVLRTAADGLPREGLAECLGSAYFGGAARAPARLLARMGYVDECTMPLERCLARAETQLAGAARATAPKRAAAAQRDLARLRRGAPPLLETARRLRDLARTRPLDEHVRALGEVLAGLGLAVATDGDPRPRDGAALGAFLTVLEELADVAPALDGGRPIAFATFLARVLGAVEGVAVEEGALRASSVRVLAIPQARGLDFDAVFVLGLDDGSFPAPRREHPLLDDALRAAVNRHAPAVLRRSLGPAARGAPLGRVLRGSSETRAEEPFLFYLAVSTAEERVVLSHPTHDETGNPLVRSPYLDEVLALAPWAASEHATRSPLVPMPEDCREPAELVNRAVLEAAAGRPGLLAAVGGTMAAETLPRLVERVAIEQRRARYFLLDPEREGAAKGRLADPFVGRLAATAALRARVRAMEWSASALEDLGSCGFKFFARRLLALAPAEEAGPELDTPAEGRLLHGLLERLLGVLDEWPADPEAAAALAQRHMRAWRTELADELPPVDAGLFDLAWERARELLMELARAEAADAGRLPRGARRLRRLEWPFRFTIADHRLEPEGRLDLAVVGAVDRADLVLDASGCVVAATVLDYKNAKRAADYAPGIDPARAMGKTAFQVPVYALALRSAGELTWAPAARLEGGYVLLRADRKRVVHALAPSLLLDDPAARRAFQGDEAARPLASRIVELVARATDGRFDVDPALCKPFCPYRHVCRYQPPPEEPE